MATTSSGAARPRQRPSLAAPGLLLGLGMGGFVDGIVLHQILQWHQMLSTTARYGSGTLADVRVNVTADGLFHAGTWLLVALGLVLLWRAARSGMAPGSGRALVGWMLVGWGLFNLVEGTVDHHLLRVHRVRPDAAAPLAWDLGFLVLGALLVLTGWLVARGGPRRRSTA